MSHYDTHVNCPVCRKLDVTSDYRPCSDECEGVVAELRAHGLEQRRLDNLQAQPEYQAVLAKLAALEIRSEALQSVLHRLINKSNDITWAWRHKTSVPLTAYDRLYEAQIDAEEVTSSLSPLERKK